MPREIVRARYKVVKLEREIRRRWRKASGLGPYPEPSRDVDNQMGDPAYSEGFTRSFDERLNEWIPDDEKDEIGLLEIANEDLILDQLFHELIVALDSDQSDAEEYRK